MIKKSLAIIAILCVQCVALSACTDTSLHPTLTDSAITEVNEKDEIATDSTDFTTQFWLAVDKGIAFAKEDGGYGLLKDLDFDGIPELLMINGGYCKCYYDIYNLCGDFPVFIGTIKTSDDVTNSTKLTVPELTLYKNSKTKDCFYVAQLYSGLDSYGYAKSYMYHIKGCSINTTLLSDCEFDFANDDCLYINKNSVNGEDTTPIGKVDYNSLTAYSDGLSDYLSGYDKLEVLTLNECWVNNDLDLSKKAHKQAEELLSKVSDETKHKYHQTSSEYVSVDGINYSKLIEKWGRDHAEYIDYTPNVPLPLSDLSQFKNLKELSLFLDDDKSFNFSTIQNLSALKSLYISSNNFIDISSLAGLAKLESLYLKSNNLINITQLTGMTNLKDLTLDSKKLELSSLDKLQSLETLTLYCTNDTDISKISGLTNLKRLILRGNAVSDLSSLNDLPLLESLSIDSTSINLDSLQQFTGLQELHMQCAQIKDLSPLRKLKALRVVDVFSSDGNIDYIKPLYDIQNLEAIEYNYLITDEQLQALRTNLPDSALIYVP